MASINQGMDPKAAAMAVNSAIRVTPEMISAAIDFVQQGRPSDIVVTGNRSGTFVSYSEDNFITRCAMVPGNAEAGRVYSNFDDRPQYVKPGETITLDLGKLGKELGPKEFVMNYDNYKSFCEESHGMSHLAFESVNEKGHKRIYVVVGKDDFDRALSISKAINKGQFLNLGMEMTELKSLAKERGDSTLVRSGYLSEKELAELKKDGNLKEIPYSVEQVRTSAEKKYVITTLKNHEYGLRVAISEAKINTTGKVYEFVQVKAEERKLVHENLMKQLADRNKDLVIGDRMAPDHAIVKSKEKIQLVRVRSDGSFVPVKDSKEISLNDRDWQKLVYKELLRYSMPKELAPDKASQELSGYFREKGTIKKSFEDRAISVKKALSHTVAEVMSQDPHFKDNLTRLANAQAHAVINKDDNLSRDLDDDISLCGRAEFGKLPSDLSDLSDSYSTVPRETVTQELNEAQNKFANILLGMDDVYKLETLGEKDLAAITEKTNVQIDKTDIENIRNEPSMAAFTRESPRMRELILEDFYDGINAQRDPLCVHEVSLEEIDRDTFDYEKDYSSMENREEDLDEHDFNE